MFSSAPPLVSLDDPPVYRPPSERLRLAIFAPLLLSTVRVEVDAWVRSNVVDPPEKGTLVSAMVRSLNVFPPVKVCVVERSARVIVPAGMVAVVPPAPGVSVSALAPLTVKLPSSVNVPVVQEGAPVAPERSACPVDPTLLSSNESASE